MRIEIILVLALSTAEHSLATNHSTQRLQGSATAEQAVVGQTIVNEESTSQDDSEKIFEDARDLIDFSGNDLGRMSAGKRLLVLLSDRGHPQAAQLLESVNLFLEKKLATKERHAACDPGFEQTESRSTELSTICENLSVSYESAKNMGASHRETLEEGARQGHPEAWVGLGDYLMALYSQNYEISNKAIDCFEAAKALGSVDAATRLGELFEGGTPLHRRNLDRAIVNFRFAAERGSQAAGKALERVIEKASQH